MTNRNDEHYEDRLEFIEVLLPREYGLSVNHLETVAYEKNFG